MCCGSQNPLKGNDAVIERGGSISIDARQSNIKSLTRALVPVLDELKCDALLMRWVSFHI